MEGRPKSALLTSEDWWAVWLGSLLMLVTVMQAIPSVPGVQVWTDTVGVAVAGQGAGLAALCLGLGVLTALAVGSAGGSATRYLTGFVAVFLLATVAYGAAQHSAIRASGFGYAFWALALGLLVSNTIGTPAWLRPALRGELFIKTGLVLLGAEILFSRILALGGPGLFVAWLVTPIVLVFMFRFGTRTLRMGSKSLVIVIAAATSVCGVSAAIAVAAAARAKREELTLAVGMTLIFTVGMMVLMPLGVRAVGMDTMVAAAWMGGTIDATGAVVAAGAMLGQQAEQVAALVKMIQNILIGVVAFCIAVYWVSRVEASPGDARPGVMEIWHRFPKFIIGFVAASLIFSFVLTPAMGDAGVAGVLDLTSDLRGWFFCLAFVSIGLESNFRDLARETKGGKAIQLYLVGQTFNLVLTLIAAYLAFGGVLFSPPMTAASGLSGVPGEVIHANVEADRDATALFYTEVEGWDRWDRGPAIGDQGSGQ